MGRACVSIIVACRNERATIGRFLESLSGQVAPGLSMEAVIADGMSDDGTREILGEFALRHPWIRVADNPRRTASAGLNLALRDSRGEFVLRMDAHTEYAPDYVAECVAALRITGASNVGGPARTKAAGFWQAAIALAFHSPFYSGGSRFHNTGYEGPVPTVPYGCWRRATLEALGGFDEELHRNQDDELNFRIAESGGVIWQSPRIRSWYCPRSSLRALARQYFDYGWWKAVVIRKHGRPAEWRQIAPAAALIVLGAFAVAMPPVSLAGVAVYALASVAASLAALKRFRDVRYLAALPVVFGTVHVSYGLGMLKRFASPRRLREYTYELQREQVAERVFAMLRSLHLSESSQLTIADIGCGRGQWLRKLAGWRKGGVRLWGLDIHPTRIRAARETIRDASLVRADCRRTPFRDEAFDVVTQFTVFTSLTTADSRQAAAREMLRLVKPGGLIVWYDFFAPNPLNRATRPVRKDEIQALFPQCEISLERVALAAPLARFLARFSSRAVRAGERIPWLRTHYLAGIRKPGAGDGIRPAAVAAGTVEA